TVAFLPTLVLLLSAVLYLAFERPFMAVGAGSRGPDPGGGARAVRRPGTAVVGLLAVALAVGTGCSRPEPRARNVILVSVDTLRPDFLSCYRPELDTTPNVARFAEGAAMFTDVLSQAPSTTISHKSLLYGLYPAVHKATSAHRPRESVASPVEALRARGFRTAAFVGGGGLAPELGFPLGFESYEVLPKLRTGRQLETLRSESIAWLREHRAERFFLFLHMYQPHCPYSPPEPYASRASWYRGDVDPEGKCGREYMAMNLEDDDYRYLRDLYAAEVAYTDDYLGDLFTELDDLGLTDETIVILTSDHGESLGERGHVGHNLPFDLQLRIPLLIRIPGSPGSVLDSPVESVDVVPTVFDALDLPLPFPPNGRSLLGLIDRGEAPPPRARYAQEGDTVSIHMGPWHLIQSGTSVELYRPEEDPEEWTNLADRHPDVVQALRDEYFRMLDACVTVSAHFESTFGKPVPLEDDTVERLRGLGYVD
ncbi:MAG TPA: sulfatase, partial [bacterium]|nr:sulfatase [bacterium]